MMLHVCSEHNRAFILGSGYLVPEFFMNTQAENALEFVDDSGHPGAGTNDSVIRRGVDVGLDDLQRLVIGARHRSAGDGGLAVRVANKRRDFAAHHFLDGPEHAPTGGPVRIEDSLPSAWRLKLLVNAQDIGTERREIRLKVHMRHRSQMPGADLNPNRYS